MAESEERVDAKPGAGCGTAVLAVVGIGVAIGLLWAVLGGSGSESEGPDGGATLACSHFRNVASDYRDWVLTSEELRDKLREVDDSAQVSEEPGIGPNARRMLAAATSGDEGELANAVTAFDAACTSAGV